MMSRVAVLRRVATPDVTAFEAEPQMDPRVAQPNALAADARRRVGEPDLVEMRACRGHNVLLESHSRADVTPMPMAHTSPDTRHRRDRKSTRLNSSHPSISYAVFCLKKKNKKT